MDLNAFLSPVERGVEPEVAAVDPAGAAVEEKGAAVERSSNSGNRTGARFKVSGASGCGGRATSDPPSSRVMTHLASGSVWVIGPRAKVEVETRRGGREDAVISPRTSRSLSSSRV